MSLGVLNNLPAMFAAYNLNNTQAGLTKTLQQLSSGSQINSGADDAAGLSLVDGLAANSAALQQSSINATEGVGLLQVADGALSQVTSLLNRAVTLATEASNGTLSSSQLTAAQAEYSSIMGEINNIGSTTTYNQQAVFGNAAGVAIFTGDSSTAGSSTDTLSVGDLNASTALGFSASSVAFATGAFTATNTAGTATPGADSISTNAGAQTALTDLNSAISAVALQDGYVGSQINTLNSISNVESTEQQNIVGAQNAVQATDYATATSNLSKYEILTQTGISALAQANSVQQEVTKLLQ
ncbi:MAG TPA: flagellin [Terracidiphilus sp.]